MKFIRNLLRKLDQLVWGSDTRKMSVWQARLVGAERIGYLAVRDLFLDGQLSLRAMSLVYTTLLSLVPLLAVSVSVLKGFGAHHQIEVIMANLLVALGDRGKEISDAVIKFVENINSGLLGSLGLALLFYTVISLMQKIERAFNFTWRVSEERSFARRFSDYLSVILIGPVLMFSAMGITATISNSTLYQQLSEFVIFSFIFGAFSHLLPYLLIIIAFTMIYIFVPNTKVHLRSALVGAIVAGIVWQTVGWLFASFVSKANYTAIYSAFAALFFFMIWLYISWSILLTGANIAFYFQNPEYRTRRRLELRLSNRMKEKLALAIMAQVATRYYTRQHPLTLRGLAQRLNVATESIHPIIICLLEKELLLRTATDPCGFIPAQAPETILLVDIVGTIREAEEDDIMHLDRIPHSAEVERLFDSYQMAITKELEGKTLKDLVDFDDKGNESETVADTLAK